MNMASAEVTYHQRIHWTAQLLKFQCRISW